MFSGVLSLGFLGWVSFALAVGFFFLLWIPKSGAQFAHGSCQIGFWLLFLLLLVGVLCVFGGRRDLSIIFDPFEGKGGLGESVLVVMAYIALFAIKCKENFIYINLIVFIMRINKFNLQKNNLICKKIENDLSFLDYVIGNHHLNIQ